MAATDRGKEKREHKRKRGSRNEDIKSHPVTKTPNKKKRSSRNVIRKMI